MGYWCVVGFSPSLVMRLVGLNKNLSTVIARRLGFPVKLLEKALSQP